MAKKSLKDKLKAKKMVDKDTLPADNVEAKEVVKEVKKKHFNFKRIGIQWFDKEYRMIDEKLAIQDPFVYAQSKLEPHDGPMRVSFSLEDQEDAKKMSDFLLQLVGVLPMVTRKKSISTSKLSDSKDPEADKEALIKSISGDFETVEEAKEHLRSVGFAFLSKEFIEAMELPFKAKEDDLHLTFMFLKIKESKVNPLSDKYDPTLAFGFDLDNQNDGVIAYYFEKRIAMELTDTADSNERQVEFIKYPKYIVHEERLKMSIEVRALSTESRAKPSKLLIRWCPYIDFPTNVRETLKEKFPELVFKGEETDED